MHILKEKKKWSIDNKYNKINEDLHFVRWKMSHKSEHCLFQGYLTFLFLTKDESTRINAFPMTKQSDSENFSVVYTKSYKQGCFAHKITAKEIVWQTDEQLLKRLSGKLIENLKSGMPQTNFIWLTSTEGRLTTTEILGYIIRHLCKSAMSAMKKQRKTMEGSSHPHLRKKWR